MSLIWTWYDQVCGAVIPQDQRLQLDAMAAHMTSSAFAAADVLSAAVETGARESLAAPLQLAACKALIASVLAPAPHSPPFLPLTLKLLRQVRIQPALRERCAPASRILIVIARQTLEIEISADHVILSFNPSKLLPRSTSLSS